MNEDLTPQFLTATKAVGGELLPSRVPHSRANSVNTNRDIRNESQEIKAFKQAKINLNSIPNIINCLEQIEDEIIRSPQITPDQEARIRKDLQNISANERVYKGSLENLEKTLKKLGEIDLERLSKLEKDMSFGSEQSKKFKKSQIDIERSKIEFSDNIIEFKQKLEALINNLNLQITSSLKTVRSNPQEALHFLSSAKSSIRDILNQESEIKKKESQIMRLHKAQKQLLKESRYIII